MFVAAVTAAEMTGAAAAGEVPLRVHTHSALVYLPVVESAPLHRIPAWIYIDMI